TPEPEKSDVTLLIGGQPLPPQHVVPVNASFDNLTVEQKYDILTKGVPFSSNAGEQETENQAVQFPD
ncbi:5588_t:CDS:2, partial [Racocetra fulgida]